VVFLLLFTMMMMRSTVSVALRRRLFRPHQVSSKGLLGSDLLFRSLLSQTGALTHLKVNGTLLIRHATQPSAFRPLTTSPSFRADDDVVEEENPLFRSSPRFEEVENLSPYLKDVLSRNGFERMTEVQAETFQPVLEGRNVLARSRTGSGKTLAFLLPSLQRILTQKQEKEGVQMLVLSPTRELAQQTYETARMLSSSSRGIGSQVLFGGVPKGNDIRQMERKIPTILAATPGRLLDHMKASYIRGRPFSEYCQKLQILVLDEVDRLLDMGFQDDLHRILSHLGTNDRQTLFFSATLPKEVRRMVGRFVSKEPDGSPSPIEMIDCIQEEDPSSHTALSVDQSHVILPNDKLVSGVAQILLDLMNSNRDHKILVFFPTTSQVAYFANLFNTGIGRRVLEIHSKKSQANRTRTSEMFRRAEGNAVMFTSDVSARGVDYPDVTHVVQFGVASDRETYIHRLGRTARAGKRGQGLLVLSEIERDFLTKDLHGIAIPRHVALQSLISDEPLSAQLEDDLMRIHNAMRTGSAYDLQRDARSVYRSKFGFYGSRLKSLGVRGRDPLVHFVNSFAIQAGLTELPTISESLARQHGLSGHPELNIQSRWERGSRFNVGRNKGFGGRRVSQWEDDYDSEDGGRHQTRWSEYFSDGSKNRESRVPRWKRGNGRRGEPTRR
jgi:ATP-dependent RNA helicase MSS116